MAHRVISLPRGNPVAFGPKQRAIVDFLDALTWRLFGAIPVLRSVVRLAPFHSRRFGGSGL